MWYPLPVLSLFTDFLYDRAAAINVLRGGLALLAVIGPEITDSGKIGWWLGKIGLVAALAMKSPVPLVKKESTP